LQFKKKIDFVVSFITIFGTLSFRVAVRPCGRLSEVKSSLSATTQLSATRHRLFHPRADTVTDVFPPSASAASGHHDDGCRGDDALIELSDDWSGTGRPEVTSRDAPLYVAPLDFDDADWRLRRSDLRTIRLLPLLPSSHLNLLATQCRIGRKKPSCQKPARSVCPFR